MTTATDPVKILELPLTKIRLDGGTQGRAEIVEYFINEYAREYENGNELPPVVVFFDGSSYWLGDGFHRYHGSQKASRKCIRAKVVSGSLRDAILYSIGANTRHGFRRTRQDIARAVWIALTDPIWSTWTNAEIAKRTGVSHTYVGNVRRRMEGKDGIQIRAAGGWKLLAPKNDEQDVIEEEESAEKEPLFHEPKTTVEKVAAEAAAAKKIVKKDDEKTYRNRLVRSIRKVSKQATNVEGCEHITESCQQWIEELTAYTRKKTDAGSERNDR